MGFSKAGRWLAIVVAAGFVASCQMASSANRKTQLKIKRVANERKKTEIRKQIRIKKMEARDVTGQLSRVELQLADTQTSLAGNKIKLLNAQSDLQLTLERLERTQKQLKRRQGLLERRVVDMYEGDDVEYINVLLGSTDMWTFLTRAYYMQAILDADTKLIHQIQADKHQIEIDKKRQVANVASIASLQVRLEAERNQVADLVDTKAQQLDQIENTKELLEQALDELDAESRRIENEIQRYQNTPTGRRRAMTPFKGGLMRPVNGQLRSGFGYRIHPIKGVRSFHTGVDLACSYGTPIKCAADGVVISAGYGRIYGYSVLVDHGGGVSTFYGHCSRLMCRSGQTVRRGEVIARVGSTGWSTGNHVHFERRQYGKAVNPL